MPGFLKRFIKNRRGTAAVEFAMILPLMVTMLAGVVEVSNLISAQRKALAAAYTAADLIAQERSVGATEVSEILQASRLVIDPFPDTAISIGVASVRYDAGSGTPSVDWTSSYNSGTVLNPTTLAAGLGQAGDSVVIVSVVFTYNPIFSVILPSTFTFQEIATTRPRLYTFVEYI